MDEAYWQGFVEKCAELGVDPEELLKQAQLGATLKGTVGPMASKAWKVVMDAVRKFGATAAGKGIGQFGRGVAAPYKALGRSLAGGGTARSGSVRQGEAAGESAVSRSIPADVADGAQLCGGGDHG